MHHDRERALCFDPVAEAYDRFRPSYPDAVVDAAVERSGLPPGGRILEVGCGTGKASRPFCERGFAVRAVEPGSRLADVARRSLAGFDFAVTVARFEDTVEEPGSFDLVLSAQAFHWVDPAVSYAKAHRALRPTGALALLWNMHPGTEPGFVADVDAIYAKHAPEMTGAAPREQRRREQTAKIDATGLFGPVEAVTHRFETRLDTSAYLGLLDTYSDHMALPPARRRDLFNALAELIDGTYAGTVTRAYVSTLLLARPRRDA